MPGAEPRTCRKGRVLAAVAAGALFALAAPLGNAQSPLRFTPTFSSNLTWTSNVDLSPDETRVSDFVLTLTPGFRVDYEAPRSLLRGYVALPILLYAKTGTENNEVRPLVDLSGQIELIDNFLFVEASANVQQTFFSPFGPRPPNLTSATDNRLEEQTYRVTPYIQGTIGGNISYLLRDENAWILLDDAPLGAKREYRNALFGTINRAATPLGWGADVERTVYDFEDQENEQYVELARLRAVYQPSPIWEVYATGGYERNRFTLTSSDGPIYGGGLRWRPTGRTLLDVFAEHRFFGESYAVQFDHRTPRSTWNFRASRNITSSSEPLLRLPAGSFVPGILNQLYLSQIPDPAERAQFIANYMQQQNLPVVVSSAVTLYGQRLLLEEIIAGAIGILGSRNMLVFAAYRNDVQPIAGSGNPLPPGILSLYDYTDWGGGVTWSYQLAPETPLTVIVSGSQSTPNQDRIGKSNTWRFEATTSRPVGARSSLVFGARYLGGDSEFSGDYTEAAVYVGFSYSYR